VVAHRPDEGHPQDPAHLEVDHRSILLLDVLTIWYYYVQTTTIWQEATCASVSP
jgi:hypothetical protein